MGIGTLLLEHLAAAARARGITRLHADVLAVNASMLHVINGSGFNARTEGASEVCEVVLDTALTPVTLRQIMLREQQAGVASLGPLLAPRSVAVVGAGRSGGVGHEIVRNLLDGGFTGSVYPINPHAAEVCGLPAHPAVRGLPGRVDLAVIAVPADAVRSVVEECCTAGIPAVVVTSAGFGEAGAAGRAEQRELVALARRHGTRLVGPNCLGVVNTAADVSLNASFAPATPTAGGLSLASQSGAVGIAVLDHATRSGLGIAEFVSLRNKADVSGNDLLLRWWREPHTKVIGLYLESFGNPRKFAHIARAIGATKPVLVVKGGRSAGGVRGGASHTAAAATPDTVLEALFAQSGVLRLDTMPDLLDAARVLADTPLPRGSRLAILGNAGGAGILAADAADSAGLTVPPLSSSALSALAAVAPTATDNPVDLGAGATAASFADALGVLLASGEVDAVVAVVAATRANAPADAVRAVAETAARQDEVPVLLTELGVPGAPTVVTAPGMRLPVFAFPEQAVRALGHAARYAAWRRKPKGEVPVLVDTDVAAARAQAEAFLDASPCGAWLSGADASDLLRCFGVAVVRTDVAATAQESVALAEAIGYPVVLKTAVETITHKTDIGAVQVGLRDAAQVLAAHAHITNATGDPRVQVQQMAAAGVEIAVGLARDPRFGPVVMVGAGGVLTDFTDDRAWRGLPLTDRDAEEMIASLTCAALLAGYRGAPPADVTALRDLLHRVALMADQLPEVAELDLNPVIVGATGALTVDVKLRLSPPTPGPDAALRRMS
jgi:acyl-CoA synthetase (NDP forming)